MGSLPEFGSTRATGNTGTHTGTLYSASGTVLATGTFSNETATGWQMLNFSDAVPVTAGTTYIAAYYAPNGHYAADPWFFVSHGFSSGKLSAPGGQSTPNGVYAGGNRFPDQSFRNTNYYVDAVYNETDTTPLRVAATSPLGGATSVPPSSAITATFARAVDPSSISFAVLDSSNTPVPGTVSYDASSKTATFTPNQALASSTQYTATVTATATTGVGMAAPAQWSFTTAKPPAQPGVCPCTLFDDADGPSNNPSSETSSVKLGVAFKADSPGNITGIRFYKAAQNSGTHTIALWKADGTQLATATVSNESTSGWQQASFDAPVAITTNTTYIASYTAPNGRYSYTSGGLASPIVRSPLRSVSSGGRYTYGTGAPLSTSSANYWVDPVYEHSPDVAPEVTAVSPGDEATSVPVTGAVRVTFDRPVQPGTAQITVKDPSNAVVPGNTTLETAGSAATFTPSNDLHIWYQVQRVGERRHESRRERNDAGCHQSVHDLRSRRLPLLAHGNNDAAHPSGRRRLLGCHTRTEVQARVSMASYEVCGTTATPQIPAPTSASCSAAGGNELASVHDPDPELPVGSRQTSQAQYRSTADPHTSSATTRRTATTPLARATLRVRSSTTRSARSVSGGVYANGNNFPNSSYLNTNYYVDVIFTTDEDGPPVVSSTTPDDQASGIQVDSVVKAKFDRASDSTTR